MALNIDTIRSLDANKTYYLADIANRFATANAQRLPNQPPPPRRHLAQASPAEKALEISSPCNLSTGYV